MKDYKLDLHVHTPASIDYKGGSGQKAFKELLEAYHEQDVDLIAITDHNTIQGYLDYCKYREQANQVYQLMLGRDESSEIISQLAGEVQCYSKVAVLPGVEISVYPGIHLILVFEPAVVGAVTAFLRDDLGLGEAVTTGDPAKVSQLSAVAVIEKAEELFSDQFFCILPHVESSKGGWKDLVGQPRADLFKHNSVLAVQFLNPDTRIHIKKALGNSDYKRIRPFKFIQASDYHGAPSVKPAQQFSIVASEVPLDWRQLRNALIGDDEFRSSCEHVEERLQKYLKGRPQLQIEFQNNMSLNEERRNDLMQSLSALLNTPHCTLRINLFNAVETKEKGSDAIVELIKDLTKSLDSADPFAFNIAQFHDSDTRQRFCIEVPTSSRIRLWSNIAWIAGENGVARPAKAWEIERQVSQSFYNRYGKEKQRSLVRASGELLMISNSFPAFSIASRIDRLLSKERLPGFSASFEVSESRSGKRESGVFSNGFVKGDHYAVGEHGLLKGGRLAKQNDYYRFTTPLFRQNESHADGVFRLKEPSVLLTTNGAATFSDEILPVYCSAPVFVITSNSEDDFMKKDQLLGLVAFLKSSFLLWYSSTIHQTDDIFDLVISNKRMPMPVDVNWLSSLSKYSRNIILSEKGFLSANDDLMEHKKDKQVLTKNIEEHNGSVLDNIHLIDKEVFRYLEFDKNEVNEVFRVLKELDLYDYGISEILPEFADSLFAVNSHG